MGRPSRRTSVAAAVYVGAMVLAWWFAVPESSGDTWRYYELPLLAPVNTGLIPPLFVRTLNHPDLVTFGFVVVSAASWLALAAAVRRAVPSPRIGAGLALWVLLISLTAGVWCWNTLLYSESLTMSACALWFAALIWSCRVSPGGLASTSALALTTVLVVITRPQLAMIIPVITAVAGAWLFMRLRAMSSAALLLGSSVLALGLGAWRLLALQADPEWSVFYKVNNYVDKTMSFRAYADSVMPPCPPLQQAMIGPAPWTDAWLVRDSFASVCPETYLWFRSDASDLVNWATSVPGDAIANFAAVAPSVTLIVQSQGRALPDWLSALVLPDWPVWLLLALGLAVGAALAFIAGARLRITSSWVLGALLIVGAWSAHVFAVWGADGLELERHLMPATTFAVIGAVVLPAALIRRPGEVLSRRQEVDDSRATADA